MLEFLDLEQQSFGLDISDFSIKIAKLKKKGRFFELASFNEMKIKPGIVWKGEVKKPDELSEIIKKAIGDVRGEKLGTKNAIVSLSEEKAFLQTIQMPRLSEEDLGSAIVFEAENHIPLAIEKVYLDYRVISSPSRLDYLDVLIVAFPRKIIDSYIACLKKANIKPVVLEPESLAISRAFIKTEDVGRPALLVDFGANRTVFIIFAGGSVKFVFSIPVSSASFSEAIARAMKTDLIQAEKLKIKYGLEEKSTKTGKEIFEALIPPLTDLTEQVKKYFDYCETHANGKKIEKVLICGGGAKLKGLVSFLSAELKMPVAAGDPWMNILPPADESGKQSLIFKREQSLEYATALGLALRGIRKIRH